MSVTTQKPPANGGLIFDLTERVLPPGVDTSMPTAEEQGVWLVRRALGAHGFAAEREIGYLRSRERKAIRAGISALRESGEVREVLMATNPNLEGDATAMYLRGLIAPLGIRVTRLARGLPVGADLEYADDVTLSRALEGRQDV